MSQSQGAGEDDLSPVLSTCLYCGGPIEIKIDRKGRLVRLEPGKPDWHLCKKPSLTTHTRNRDVITASPKGDPISPKQNYHQQLARSSRQGRKYRRRFRS